MLSCVSASGPSSFSTWAFVLLHLGLRPSPLGPLSFSPWALLNMSATICWRVSTDYLVLLLVIGSCIWIVLGFLSRRLGKIGVGKRSIFVGSWSCAYLYCFATIFCMILFINETNLGLMVIPLCVFCFYLCIMVCDN